MSKKSNEEHNVIYERVSGCYDDLVVKELTVGEMVKIERIRKERDIEQEGLEFGAIMLEHCLFKGGKALSAEEVSALPLTVFLKCFNLITSKLPQYT